jgi:hypothetical protein
MFRLRVQLVCVIALAMLVSGCDVLPDFGGATPVPPAVEMLPDLPDYNVVEGQTLTDHITALSGGAAMLAGQPELAAAILAVDQVVGCYQEVGAVRARVYSHREQPLSAGAVAIADRNALTDPINLFKCVVPTVLDSASAEEASTIQPCSASYTLERDDNEFYIVYAGTTEEICHTFCANLEGCTAH